MNFRQQIDDYIENHTEELTGFLSELISYPSVMGEAEENAPFGRANRLVLEHFLSKCEEYGFITHNYEGYAGHADMNGLPPGLGILCHLDVVPEGTGWHSDPFKAEIRDGKVFGRGAIDDKGPAAATLFAMRCLSQLNVPLSKGVRIIVGCNEENGSEDMEYYTKQTDFPPLLVTPDGSYPVINIEKGMLRCEITARLPQTSLVSLKGGSVINAVPELCTAVVKGITPFDVMCCADDTDGIFFSSESVPEGLKITARGVCAHASTPEQGKNAVTAMLMLLKNLRVDTGETIAALSRLFPYGETDGSSAGIKCSDDISGALTAVLSVLEVTDDRLVGKIDCRFPVSEELEGISSRLCESIEAEGILAEIIMGSEPHYVDSDSDFIRTLLDVYEEMTGKKGECIAIGGGTYVHETQGGVAFGAEFPGDDNHMHGADEFITIENLKLNAKIYANAIVRLCGGENA